jgi:hypothetical protein
MKHGRIAPIAPVAQWYRHYDFPIFSWPGKSSSGDIPLLDVFSGSLFLLKT